jgi:hypothetical protein
MQDILMPGRREVLWVLMIHTSIKALPDLQTPVIIVYVVADAAATL